MLMQVIKIIAEENQDTYSDVRDLELAFFKSVDAMARRYGSYLVSEEEDKARLCEYERKCRERASKGLTQNSNLFLVKASN